MWVRSVISSVAFVCYMFCSGRLQHSYISRTIYAFLYFKQHCCLYTLSFLFALFLLCVFVCCTSCVCCVSYIGVFVTIHCGILGWVKAQQVNHFFPRLCYKVIRIFYCQTCHFVCLISIIVRWTHLSREHSPPLAEYKSTSWRKCQQKILCVSSFSAVMVKRAGFVIIMVPLELLFWVYCQRNL